MNTLRRVFGYAKPWRKDMVIAGVYSFANKFFDVFPEILIGIAIDVVVEREESFIAGLGFETPKEQLGILAFLTFLIWALESVTEYAALVRWRHLAQKLQHALRMDGVRHSLFLDLKWHENRNSGQLLSVLSEDVNQVERFLNEGIHNILQLLVSSLLVGFVFFYVSPMIALFALLPIPLILYGGLRFRRRLEGSYKRVRKAAGHLTGALSGMMSGITTIRAFTAERHLEGHIEGLSDAYNECNKKAINLSTAFVPIIRIAVLAGFLCTLVIGGLKTFDGEISAAAFAVLVFLTQRLLWPFTRFGEILDLYERSMASAKRVLDLLDTKIVIKDNPKAAPLERLKGDIAFKNIHFAYEKDAAVLEDLSLTIKQGQFIALVGPTGSGKSTIAKLLLRFYEPQRGEVLLDGKPLNALKMQDVRRNIGYVSQDVFMLDASIADNIRLSAPKAPLEEVEEATKTAEAYEFIAKMPDTYQTEIGERGQKISGGQRQRLAIARGLMGLPPILILDEATSAVDNETEAAIQRSIERFQKDQKRGERHTVIVIAHRLSTIVNADQIYVLDKGKIVESGSHDTLKSQDGLYRRLWSIQTGNA